MQRRWKLWDDVDPHERRARLLLGYASALPLDRREEAVEKLELALGLFRRSDNQENVAQCLLRLARLLILDRQFERSIPYTFEARSIIRSLPDPRDVAAALTDLSSILWHLNYYEDALDLYAESVSLHRNHSKPDELCRALLRLANELFKVGRYEESLRLAEESLQLAWELRAEKEIVDGICAVAGCLVESDRSYQAIEFLDKAIDVVRRWDMPLALAECLSAQAQAMDSAGAALVSVGLLKEALAIVVECNPGSTLHATLLHLMGSAEVSLHFPDSAIEYLGQAADMYEQGAHAYHQQLGTLSPLLPLALALWRQGRLAEAAGAIEKEVDNLEWISVRFANPQNRRSIRARHIVSYQVAVSISVDQGDHSAAFTYAQRAKGRTLTELLESRGELSDLDRRELLLTQQVEAGLIDHDAYATGVRHIQDERVARRESLLGTDPRQPLSLDVIAAALHPGEALIDAIEISTDGTLAVFLVLPGSTSVTWMGTVEGESLSRLVRDWERAREAWVRATRLLALSPIERQQEIAQLLALPPDQRPSGIRTTASTNDLRAQQSRAAAEESILLERLGDVVLADMIPLLEKHRVTRLILSPGGVLHKVPLAALRVCDDSGTHHLIDRFGLQLIPTASSLAILRKPGAPRVTWPPALLAAAPYAAPAADMGTPPVDRSQVETFALRELVERAQVPGVLSASGREIDAVAASLRNAAGASLPVTVLHRETATREAILAHLPGARVVHVSTHGTSLEAGESLMRYEIRLAGDTAITVGEVYDGTVSLHDVFVVALSACHLGAAHQHGAEALGFTQAFLQAGAGVILAPIWAVEDTSTAILMERWYTHLAGDDRPAVAASWQRAVHDIRTQPAYRHPFFWAGFLPSGDGALRLTPNGA